MLAPSVEPGLYRDRVFVPGWELVRTLLRVLAMAALLLAALAAGRFTPVAAQSACDSQSTDPNSPLIRDCQTLLELKNDLDPNDVLDWDGAKKLEDWDGVIVDTTLGVTEMHLDNIGIRGLQGIIPPALGGLMNLKELSLNSMELSGSIPEELGKLVNLRVLALNANQLSGSIPEELGDLANLEILGLGGNELSGSIPEELGKLANLGTLSLARNQLSGIEAGFTGAGNLPVLTYLGLGKNRITGTIPPTFGNLTNLTQLELGDNELSGSIPEELGNLANLTNLDLGNNQLSGIEAGFTNAGNLPGLDILRLDRNQFTGTVPTTFSNLTGAALLDLSCNGFTGNVPRSLASLGRLIELYLNGNSVNLPLHADLLDTPGLSINTSSYCFATAPQNVRVKPGDKKLTVTWAAPVDDGAPASASGVAITAYNLIYIQIGPIETDRISVAGDALAHTIEGLTNGTEYAVTVQAVNDAGGGERSEWVSGTPVAGTPRPPAGVSTSSSGGGGSSGSASPAPAPARSPIIGSTPAATAKEVAGDLLVLQRHDQPGVEVEVGVGWISRDGQRIITIGFVRDGDLGQTYAVVRREGDGQVVRRWIAPDSPLVYAVPWALVNTQYTFPVGVILAIPLDEQYPWPNMLTRRFDGGDDRILAYDAELKQWRHVPDEATFQARGYYWCNVTAADAGFFGRIKLGPPYPASGEPARADYPVCQT